MASEKGFQGDPALALGAVRTWEGKYGPSTLGFLGNMAHLGLPLQGQQEPRRILSLHSE